MVISNINVFKWKNIRLIINLSYAVEVAYIGSFALYSEAQNLGVLYIFWWQ